MTLIGPKPSPTRTSRPIGIIDIGSNSVRMVVYEGLMRSPQALFNEKILCGLGRSVGSTGMIDAEAYQLALGSLKRFSSLAREMQLDHLDAVATAAVRDAGNGPDFIKDAEQQSRLSIRLLSGEEEAYYSALGVVSGIPAASGIVGDLGGGSLELVEVDQGAIGRRVSLPIGPLRLLNGAPVGRDQTLARIKAALASVPWLKAAKGRKLYLVGGSWRALARLHILRSHYPLHIVHQYEMDRPAISRLLRWLDVGVASNVAAMRKVSERRMPTLPVAGLVLQQLMATMQAKCAVVSALGLREGLLNERLAPEIRAQDPFLSAARDLATRQGRFPEHGEAILRWIDPLFDTETREERRLREAICLLSDIGWRAHPEFRAERAMVESLYGSFVGISSRERGFLGLALFLCFGGSENDDATAIARGLLSADERARAVLIGTAIRLAQRFSGGTAAPLRDSRLQLDGACIRLTIGSSHRDLGGEVVQRRLAALGRLLKRQVEIIVG